MGLRSATPPAARRPTPAAAALWGDGFAHDGVQSLWAVSDWAFCMPDEYTLLFPRLVPLAGEFPCVLRTHLERCVAVRAWRLETLDPQGAAVALRSRVPGRVDGARRHADWFADDGAVTCLLRRIGLLHTAPERLEVERMLLASLDRLLCDIQAHRQPAWDETAEALFAFGSGIHPAYLWPQAAVSQARGLVAGWLGHLDRGRTALMPTSIAEYVLDALGDGASADRQLRELAGGTGNLRVLRRAARRRLAGHDPSVRLASEENAMVSLFSGHSQQTPSRAEA